MNRIQKNLILKQKIVDELKNNPMFFFEILNATKMTKIELSNSLLALRKANFIRPYEPDMVNHPNKRRWSLVDGCPEFVDKMNMKAIPVEEKEDPQQKKGVTVISSNKYHTSGSKTKISPWFGYTSF